LKKKNSPKWVNGFIFVITMWLLSRLVIVMAMQLIAPALHHTPSTFHPNFVPTSGWELFSHWDGIWYWKIATLGYEYANDGQQHSVAFFPLFPLITRVFMSLGLPFEVAGTLVNSLGFLGAMLILYSWAEERHGISAARWATAVLAWCPFSLFGTVIYTEGLFLLLTTAALQAFDKRQHARAALWGAMATATRTIGAALIPAFLLVAWREKRPAIAYVACLATGGGLLLFSIYCGIRFADPLAFVHVQRAWQHQNWLDIFTGAFNLRLVGFSASSELTKVIMVFGSGYLLWCLRATLPRVAVAYGFCSLALLLSSGALSSVSRYVYGIVSVSLALGLLLAGRSPWGYVLIGLFSILLLGLTVRFSWWYWVA